MPYSTTCEIVHCKNCVLYKIQYLDCFTSILHKEHRESVSVNITFLSVDPTCGSTSPCLASNASLASSSQRWKSFTSPTGSCIPVNQQLAFNQIWGLLMLDWLPLTETWLNMDKLTPFSELAPSDCNYCYRTPA